jgi:acyl dehydratase
VTVAGRTYFEDLVRGALVESPALTITEAHIIQFRELTGYWTDGHDAGPAVPDLLPLCISSGLGWRIPQPLLAVLAFLGFEWQFLRPLAVGDTIRSRSATLSKRAMREGGIVVESRDIVNQREEIVQAGRLTLLVAKRPVAGS